MASGLQTLESIDRAMRDVRQDVSRLDREIEATSEQLEQLSTSESQCFRDLAKLRLDDITQGRVGFELDDADRNVAEILKSRAEAVAKLKESMTASDARQSDLESRRAAQQQTVHAAADVVEERVARVQQQLSADAAYCAQLDRATQTDSVAKRAEAKAEQAEQDRTAKGRDYEGDPLFMYLWNRKYGTTEYAAGPLFRWLDGWVAKLCRYQGARPNYSMLIEIPKRLREHADRVREAANREFEALQELEEQAAAAEGVPELRQALETAEQQSDAIDAEIKAEELHYSELIRQSSQFAGGEDDFSHRSLQVLVEQFRREPLEQLRREAEQTRIYEDNVVVEKLADLRASRRRLESQLSDRKELHLRYLKRVEELEKVRWDFKHRQFDDAQSDFPKGAAVGAILGEFLRGLASAGQLWNTIETQHQRRRGSGSGFGSGGLRPSSGGFPKMPSSGSRSSGGFRTGGGF